MNRREFLDEWWTVRYSRGFGFESGPAFIHEEIATTREEAKYLRGQAFLDKYRCSDVKIIHTCRYRLHDQ